MMLTLREVTCKDVPELVDLRMDFLNEISSTPLPTNLKGNIEDYLNKSLVNGTCFGLVAEDRQHIIAKGLICTYEVLPDEYCPNGIIGKLYSIYTIPEARGQGIMSELIIKLIELAKKKGIQHLYLAAEEKAIPLYKRIGFKLLENEMKLME